MKSDLRCTTIASFFGRLAFGADVLHFTDRAGRISGVTPRWNSAELARRSLPHSLQQAILGRGLTFLFMRIILAGHLVGCSGSG